MYSDPVRAAVGSHLHHGQEMVLVTVYTAARKQAEDMHRAATLNSAVDGVAVDRIAVKTAVGNIELQLAVGTFLKHKFGLVALL